MVGFKFLRIRARRNDQFDDHFITLNCHRYPFELTFIMKNLAARSGIHKSHSRSLRQFCEDYIVDPWKNYTFSAKGQK